MRQVWLIAWHGFVQHATSRAFVFGMLLLPIYMLIGGGLPTVSQSQLSALGGPIRHFAVIDKTGVMLPAIDAALERDVVAMGLSALADYAEEHADADSFRAKQPKLASLLLDGDPQSPGTIDAIDSDGRRRQRLCRPSPCAKARTRRPSTPRTAGSFASRSRRKYPRRGYRRSGAPISVEPKNWWPAPSGTAPLWAVLVIPPRLWRRRRKRGIFLRRYLAPRRA